MKAKALCNVLYGADLHVYGDVFEIKAEDAPGLLGAVTIIEDPAEEKTEVKEPEANAEEPKTEAKPRRTRKTTRKT